MSVSCRCLPILTELRKFQENQIKIKRDGSFRNHRRRDKGGPPPSQVARGRGPTPGHARRAPRSRGHPLVPPFGLFLPLAPKTLAETPASRISSLLRRRRASKTGTTRRPLLGTLSEGGL